MEGNSKSNNHVDVVEDLSTRVSNSFLDDGMPNSHLVSFSLVSFLLNSLFLLGGLEIPSFLFGAIFLGL